MSGERTGRPRSAAVHTAILRATRELIVEIGYARLSMDRVATRAGVGKQTVYRRWASKAALVAEVVLDRFGVADPTLRLDTDDVDQYLRNWLHHQVTFLASEENVALARALTAAAAGDLHDADALYQQFTRPHREDLIARLRAAAHKGHLRADADLDAVADVFIGAITFPLLTGSAATPSIERADGLLDVIMFGLRTDVGDTPSGRNR